MKHISHHKYSAEAQSKCLSKRTVDHQFKRLVFNAVVVSLFGYIVAVTLTGGL